MPVAARLGAVGGESDRGGDRDQPENANPQHARGSQGCTKHELPRPNFCLDHRFVRRNCAAHAGDVSCLRHAIPAQPCRLPGMADPVAVLAKVLFTNRFRLPVGRPNKSENQVRGPGVSKSLSNRCVNTPGFPEIRTQFVRCTKFLTFLCSALYNGRVREPGPPGSALSLGKGNPSCSRSKTFRATAKSISNGRASLRPPCRTVFRRSRRAYGDYAKKSFEDTKSFVEKLSGVKSLDKVLEAQTEFARSAYETFVADRRRSPASTAISPSRPSSPRRPGREVRSGCALICRTALSKVQ